MVLNHTKHDYALATLSVPVSNAVVEKVFNHVTWLKIHEQKEPQHVGFHDSCELLSKIARYLLPSDDDFFKNNGKFNKNMYI